MKKSKRRKEKNLSTIHRNFLKVGRLLKNEGLKDLFGVLVSFCIEKILTNLFK